MKPSAVTLLSITALARAGALGQAWRLFREAGLERTGDDPAVLTVRGRLLKDEARSATGASKRRFYKQAAQYYGRAADLGGQPYPLINAATLSLLAGEPRKARTLARAVLERDGDDAETAYWREATRAEALLLLGRVDDARGALSDAVGTSPQAFEDLATTLRQFGLILDCQGEPKAWLDDFRPPRALHFGGPMVIARGAEPTLRRQVRSILDQEKIGAAFGAIAAGADIVIAEALLESGAELHVVLPAPIRLFRETSVMRYGRDWEGRFDAVLRAAASCRALDEERSAPFRVAVRLAAEVAMGKASMQADMLQTEAIQLAVLATKSMKTADPSCSAWMASRWRESGRRGHIVRVHGSGGSTKTRRPSTGHACLAAMLRIGLPDVATEKGMRLLQMLASRLARSDQAPFVGPRWTGESITLVYRNATEAAEAIFLALRSPGLSEEIRVAGHYGIAYRLLDPFSRSYFVAGDAAELPSQILRSTPVGAIHVSEDFAAALHVAPTKHHLELVGELPGRSPEQTIRLFSLQ